MARGTGRPKGEYDAEDEQVDGVPTAACGGEFRGIAAQEDEEEGRAMRRSFLRGDQLQTQGTFEWDLVGKQC